MSLAADGEGGNGCKLKNWPKLFKLFPCVFKQSILIDDRGLFPLCELCISQFQLRPSTPGLTPGH